VPLAVCVTQGLANCGSAQLGCRTESLLGMLGVCRKLTSMTGSLSGTRSFGRSCRSRGGRPDRRLPCSAGRRGPALELGIGTGRIALPLSRRGVRVHGIAVSPAMVAQLRRREGAAAVDVTLGDFATMRPDGRFRLVYLLRNTITNLTTQEEQTPQRRGAGCSRKAASSSRTTFRSFDGYRRGRPRTCSPRLPPMSSRSITLRRRSRSPITTG
jgi:hypothetical protein